MLGFKQKSTSLSYWYIDRKMNRYHRSGFSKSNLIKKGLIEENDNRSESEVMKDLGYYKIFDTGQTKWYWE